MNQTATVQSCVLVGLDVRPVQVEVELLSRLPRTTIVGLQASAVAETAERVRSAIVVSGFDFPRCRIVVNLAPADLRKDGAGLDLPIAVAILAASGQYTPPEGAVFMGELGLSGSLRSTRADYAARLAYGDALRSAERYTTLRDVVMGITSLVPADPVTAPAASYVDFSQVRGAQDAIPSLIEAVRTGKPLILVGPPGCGKTMIARRFVGLLPALTVDERIELSKVYAAAGLGVFTSLDRPFRAPHYTITLAGMLGDRKMRPGEATLAHNGVLLLDEADEFGRPVLESLRSVKARGNKIGLMHGEFVELPASFRLICTVNDEERLDRLKRNAGSLLADAIVVKVDGLGRSFSAPWPSTAELRARL